ncbi:MAG: lactate utilization protein [Bacillota bacterium]|nr:lactate utilization protein [Bacillota bacterium]
MNEKVKTTMKALERNNISSYYVDKKEEVIPLVETLIKEGDTVSVGGSMSLFECGIIDYLRCGKYEFFDRYVDGLGGAEIEKIYRASFDADAYFCSSNAVTENGELYNVDGNSNRVAAIAYGPRKVIMVVGINKIVKDIDEAVLRVKRIAAPKNAVRLHCNTYCAKEGHCVKNDATFDGCASKDRLCINRLITHGQRQKERINVIFVGESLGY